MDAMGQLCINKLLRDYYYPSKLTDKSLFILSTIQATSDEFSSKHEIRWRPCADSVFYLVVQEFNKYLLLCNTLTV
jgi:hypothetical protein